MQLGQPNPSGSPTPGGASAKLSWADSVSQEGVGLDPSGLKAEVIAPGGVINAGLGFTPPSADQEAGGASAGGGLGSATAGASSATGVDTLPRHNKAIRDYFDRTDKQKADTEGTSEQ